MRIALITTSFFPQVGGAEFVVHHLASQWVDQGHEVCIFKALPKNSGQPENVRYKVRNFSVPPTYFKLSPHLYPFCRYVTWGIKREIENFEPDFISAHFGYPIGVWLSKMKPLPKYLITCHGQELTKFPWGFRNRYNIDNVLANALNDSIGAVAISSHARNLMLELGVMSNKIVEIPNGVDLERFRRKVLFNFRRRLEIPETSTVILSVGREHSQKAYDAGIRAFAHIAGENPDACYVILGQGTDKWHSLVADLQLQGRVVLCEGLQGDELIGAYQQADIFLSSSIWELMPLVVLEAMASGLPLVVTNVSGSQDLVQNGENGFVVEPGDIENMADNIKRLLLSRELRESFGNLNLTKAEGYSWDCISRRYLEVADSAKSGNR
jgi:glycosyltransferase involved in cell wall biosynthesis